MTRPWLRLWSEKILSSINLRQCNFTEQSVYLQLLLRARTEGELAGMLCYPDGQPIPDQVLAEDMKLKISLFIKAKDKLIERSILIKTPNGLLIRKYKDLQKKKGDFEDKDEFSGTEGEQEENKSGTSAEQVRNKSIPNSLPDKEFDPKIATEQNRTEQNRIDKEEASPSSKEINALDHTALYLATQYERLCSNSIPLSKTRNYFLDHLKDGVPANLIEQKINEAGNGMFQPRHPAFDFLKAVKDWWLTNRADILKKTQGEKAQEETCPACQGTGVDKNQPVEVSVPQNLGGGSISGYKECPVCKGSKKRKKK